MKKSGMTGQDQHDLNKVSKTLKQDESKGNSKSFFKGINQKSQGKASNKNDGYFKERSK